MAVGHGRHTHPPTPPSLPLAGDTLRLLLCVYDSMQSQQTALANNMLAVHGVCCGMPQWEGRRRW